MISLLTNLLHLDAVSTILLLSRNGTPLCKMGSSNSVSVGKEVEVWGNILENLGSLQYARFVFEQGSCGCFQTNIGTIVVILDGWRGFDDAKALYAAFDEKSVDVTAQKEFLLQLLSEVEDSFKLAVIDELAVMADKEVGLCLVNVLQNYGNFDHDVKDRLLLSICRLLGDCSAPETMDALSEFIDKYSTDEAKNHEVEQEAKVSLQQLELIKEESEREQTENKVKDNGSQAPHPAANEKSEGRTKEKISATDDGLSQPHRSIPESAETRRKTGAEQQIKDLLAKGKKQEAVAIIMKYIEAAARQKLFAKAEKLRDTLIKIDSMMLSEIIRAAELIEEHKAASIVPEDQKTWADLIETLNTDEFTSLYHAMIRRHYPNGEKIVQQGTQLPQLLFINSGQVQLYTHVDDREVPLKTVGQGEVIGAGTFFEASVWTVSVRSQGAELLILSRKSLDALTEKHTSLESRLIDFSARFLSANAIFRKTQRSRRRHERKSLEGRAAVTLLEQDGKETEISFKGDLFDVSRGGLSLVVRVSRKKNANMLFGRRIRIAIPVGRGATRQQRYYNGKVVAVRAHHAVGNEYSLHVQFDEQLSRQEIQQLLDQG